MAQLVTEHAPWCVRDHARGQCSEKRGKWDRTTNTWDSDLTDDDREVIRTALRRWRVDGEPIGQVADWVRTHPTFAKVANTTLCTWNMTQKRHDKKGKAWP